MDSSTKDMKGMYTLSTDFRYHEANTTSVTIHLSDVDCNEQFPDRILTLSYPDFFLTVGRGSQSDENIEPGPDNAWFSSRVMSRQHALLRADPYDQILTIQDDGSMHGTFLNGDRVGKERVDLIPGDIVTFGTEVVRGVDTYQPLKVSIHYDWDEENRDKDMVSKITKDTSAPTTFRNKFTVDFSEEDFDSDDDDVEIIGESVREPSVQILDRVDTSKPQPHQSNDSSIRPLPVSALTTTEGFLNPMAASDQAPTSGQLEAPSADGDNDSQADNTPDTYPPEYYTDDEEESDVSDMFNDESDSADEVEKEGGLDTATTKVASAVQPAQTSTAQSTNTNNVLLDIEREPSPSDAALARPRLAAPSVPPAPRPIQSVQPPLPMYSSAANTYCATSDKYNLDRMYNPTFNFQNSVSSVPRPSHTFVNPYQYSPYGASCSMGTLNTYPAGTSTYPWDLWKSAPLPYDPNRPSRPVTRYGPLTGTSSAAVFANSQAKTMVDQPALNSSSSWSSAESRGKKRKIADIFNSSDDESVDSTPETTPTKSATSEGGSPAAFLSKVTETPHASVKEVENANAERADSMEVEEALEQADAFIKELQARVDQAQSESTKESSNEQHEEVIQVENVAESEAQAESEDSGRLRKRRKISPEARVTRQSRFKTALKYSATALAGATVGVLGTVVGLASLPADYFV